MIKAQTDLQMSLEGIDPLKDQTFSVIQRNGQKSSFDEMRIYRAIEKAFKAESGIKSDQFLSGEIQSGVQKITDIVVQNVLAQCLKGDELSVEGIQDEAETQLMAAGHFTVARRYIVYREEHRKVRLLRDEDERTKESELVIHVHNPVDGSKEKLDANRLRREIGHSCRHLEDRCSSQLISEEVFRTLYDGITPDEISKAMILAAKSHIEKEPAYSFIAARMLLLD